MGGRPARLVVVDRHRARAGAGPLGRRPGAVQDAVAAEGVEVLRRSSGGGPVLWDAGLLALDVVLPRGHRLAPDDVVEGYRWLGEALADALRALGVPDVEVVAVERARAAAPAGRRRLLRWPLALGGARRRAQGGGALPDPPAPGAAPGRGAARLDAARLARLLGGGDGLAADLAAAAAGLRELVPGIDPDGVAAAVDPGAGEGDRSLGRIHRRGGLRAAQGRGRNPSSATTSETRIAGLKPSSRASGARRRRCRRR